MTTERYEQIGWTTPEQDDIALMDGEGCEVGTYWTVPVYVKVPEPARCPTCGSDDRMVMGDLCDGWGDFDPAQEPDPWHSTPELDPDVGYVVVPKAWLAGPGVSADTDR